MSETHKGNEGEARQNEKLAAGEQPQTVSKGKQGAIPAKKTRKEYKIIIHSQEGPGGNRSVTPAINGKIWNIPREKEEWVPEEVKATLDRGVQTKYEVVEKGKEAEVLSKKVKRFAYSILETRTVEI